MVGWGKHTMGFYTDPDLLIVLIYVFLVCMKQKKLKNLI